MHRFLSATCVVCALGVIVPMKSAAQTFPADLPLAVVCWSEKTQRWVVGYLEVVNEDGSAIYGRDELSATLSAERLFEPPLNRQAVLDCYGKTLDELRATGRVMEIRLSQ